MIPNLEKLRQGFKNFRKKNISLSLRLSVLVEYEKIELEFVGTPHKEARCCW